MSTDLIAGLRKGQRVNFVYEYPGQGGYTRKGTVDRVKNLGLNNVIKNVDGQDFIRCYGHNPPRPKGEVLLTIYDETQGGYRSFYADYIRNLAVLN